MGGHEGFTSPVASDSPEHLLVRNPESEDRLLPSLIPLSIQSFSSLHFSRDGQVHSIVTLGRDPQLRSGTLGVEYMQWVSYLELTTTPVHK